MLARLVGQEALARAPDRGAARRAASGGLPAAADEQKIKVRGVDDLMVFRARCCNPIRGEQIVGYITRGKGVSVHSATCPNVMNLLFDPERRIDVEWDKGQDPAPYTVQTEDQRRRPPGHPGRRQRPRSADIDTNIKDVEATVDADQRGSIRMTVEISDLKHLERVMKSIRNVEGVLAVERASR